MSESCPKCGFERIEEPQCPRCGVVVSQYLAYLASVGTQETAAPAEVASPPPPAVAAGARAPKPAGFWIRALALLIDYICLVVVQYVLDGFARLLWGEEVYDSRVYRAASMAFQFVFGITYTVVFHWLWGQTFGKMVVRIRVVTVAGEPLSLRDAVVRELGYVLSLLTFGIGYLMAGLRTDKRALHDLVAGTRVEWTERRAG